MSLGSADRRYFILDVAEDRIGDKAWFSRIYRDLAKGGTAQFLNYLQTYELGSWHPRELLKTAETIEAQHESASPVLQWLQACVDDDHIVGTDGMNKLPFGKFIEANELRKAYTRFCKEHNLHPDAPNIFGKQMKKLFGDKKRISVGGGYGVAPRPWAYYIPEGDELQARIDASLGLSQSQ